MGIGVRFRLARKVSVQRIGAADVPIATITDEATEALLEASRALAGRGVRHWLTYGALLGLVRDGGFIAGDNDIDIAVVDDEKAGDAVPSLEAAGFVLLGQRGIERRRGIAKLKRGRVSFDLYFVRLENGLYAETYPVDRRSYVVGTHPPMDVAPLPVGNGTIPAPADREAYLAHLYGPQWRIPQPRWNGYFSPPNMTLHVHWRSLPRVVRRLMTYLSKG